MKRIMGGIIVFTAVVLFCYYGLWVFLIQGIRWLVVGFRDKKETIFILKQLAKIFLGFPITEIAAMIIAVMGSNIYNS